MLDQLTYKSFGDRAILIEWPAEINNKTVKEILQFKEKVIQYKKDFVEDCIIGYHSLTILYIDDVIDFKTEVGSLKSIHLEASATLELETTLWKIPVCYDVTFGIDLEEISKTLKISKEEIIQLHSETIYTIFFIGFLPGFLYLGGLDNRLIIQRKPSPRLSVPKGSVAIGGSQTGVYPMDSAGGWNIIGKTPISFFDIEKINPCFAKPGDQIQFVPISLDEFKKVEMQVNIRLYKTLNSPSND